MKSYIYQTVEPAPRGWFARVITYHDRSVGVRYCSPPEDKAEAKPVIDPTVIMTDNGDGTLTIGRWTFPKRIHRREVVAAGKAGARKDWQRLIIRCACGVVEEITLGAWRWCESHGTRACRRCQLKKGQDVKEWIFAETG